MIKYLCNLGWLAGLWCLLSVPCVACPNCKDGLLESGQAGVNLARGFELSIYLMLAAPVLILTTLATVFYLQIQRAKQAGHYPDVDSLIAQVEKSASLR